MPGGLYTENLTLNAVANTPQTFGYRGDFVCFNPGQGIGPLKITTNEGESISLIPGDSFTFKKPYSSLAISSPTANEAVSIDVGFGNKRILGRGIAQLLGAIGTGGQVVPLESSNNIGLDVLVSSLSEGFNSAISNQGNFGNSYTVETPMTAVTITGTITFPGYVEVKGTVKRGTPSTLRVYDLETGSYRPDGRIYRTGNYLIPTAGLSNINFDGATLDPADFVGVGAYLSHLPWTPPEPGPVTPNVINSITGAGTYAIAIPAAEKSVLVLGYRFVITSNAKITGGGIPVLSLGYDPGSGLVDVVSEPVYLPDTPTLGSKAQTVIDVTLPDGGILIPVNDALFFDLSADVADGVVCATVFTRDV